MWKEAAQIVLACVLAIQMGLIGEIGKLIRYEFRILSCPKCLVFWVSFGWHLLHSRSLLDSVSVSFFSSYAALWLALLYDAIAIGYNYVYDKIQHQDTPSAEAESSPGTDEVPELQ